MVDTSLLQSNPTYPFPSSARFKKQAEFQLLSKEGKKKAGRYLFVSFRVGPTAKLGITASRRFGKSHQRNRFKRLAREIFRHLRPHFQTPLEIHVVPKKEALTASYHQLFSDFEIAVSCSLIKSQE